MTGKSYLDEVREASAGGVLIRGDVVEGDVVKKPRKVEDDDSPIQPVTDHERQDRKSP